MNSRADLLPPLPPDGDPDDNHDARQKKPIDPCESSSLSHGKRDVAARFGFRPGGNQFLVLAEPIDSVEEGVAIASRTAKHLIGREVGVTDDNEPSALVVHLPAGGHAQR